MTYAFDNLDRITEVINESPFGLITDFDGTISRIAPTPYQAKVSPLCYRYLTQLQDKIRLVAVMSGRPAAVVRGMVGIYGIVYIGAHGMERWVVDHPEPSAETSRYIPVIKSVIQAVTPRLSRLQGIVIEDKGPSVTFHYRQSPEPKATEDEIISAINETEAAHGLRVMRSKMAVELLPPLNINKGTVTLELIREYRLRGVIYLGDDITDMDAFSAVHNASSMGCMGIAIGVNGRGKPDGLAAAADFTLNGIRDVGRFLKWLLQNVPQSNPPRH